MEKFINSYMRPALATAELSGGDIPLMGVFGSFGQNCINPIFDLSSCNDLHLDVEAIVGRIVGEAAVEDTSGFYPTVIMHKNPLTPDNVPAPFDPARLIIVRDRMELWKSRATVSEKRGLAWLEGLPIEAGDTVHPSHDGQIMMGNRDFYAYLSTGLSLPLLP